MARPLPTKVFAPGLLDVDGVLRSAVVGRSHLAGYYSCPATGPLKYVSDLNNSVIDVYAGKFAGQAPCGQITSALLQPYGIYVKGSTHDLYVANSNGNNVLVFHRGQTAPYNVYTDPTGQTVADVTVAADGTVIASNLYLANGSEVPSISTWIGGPNGGTFVGNFPMPNSQIGLYITARRNGTTYYDDTERTGKRVLWSVSCPTGKCGTPTQVAISAQGPFGLGVDGTGDILLNDGQTGTADTFELPNPSPSIFPLGSYPYAMAINPLNHHWFAADPMDDDAAEYSYPSGDLIGTVSPTSGGLFGAGIAVDP